MGKRCLTLVLALLQVLSLSACTGRPDTTTPLSGIGEGKGGPSPQSAPFDAAYWTAVRHESYNPSFDRTEVSTMPTEKWWADLYLNDCLLYTSACRYSNADRSYVCFAV